MSKQTHTTTSTGGIGFIGALTVLFVALKLTGVIDWAWVWVVSPIWISILVGSVLFLVAFVGFLCWEIYDAHRQAKRIKQARTQSSLRR